MRTEGLTESASDVTASHPPQKKWLPSWLRSSFHALYSSSSSVGQLRRWREPALSCLKVYLHRHVLSACPFSRSQLVLRLPCYISARWLRCLTRDKISQQRSQLVKKQSTPLPEIFFHLDVKRLSVDQPRHFYCENENLQFDVKHRRQ